MNKKLTFPELAELLSEATNTSKRMSELFLRELFATIGQCLIEGESVKVKNLGVFKVSEVSSRKSVDVNTGRTIEIAGHKKITFTPDKSMAEAVNASFACFEAVVLDDDVTNEMIQEIDDAASNEAEDAEVTSLVADEVADVQDSADEVVEEAPEDEKEDAAEHVVVTPPPFVLENVEPEADKSALEQSYEEQEDSEEEEVEPVVCADEETETAADEESAEEVSEQPEEETSETEIQPIDERVEAEEQPECSDNQVETQEEAKAAESVDSESCDSEDAVDVEESEEQEESEELEESEDMEDSEETHSRSHHHHHRHHHHRHKDTWYNRNRFGIGFMTGVLTGIVFVLACLLYLFSNGYISFTKSAPIVVDDEEIVLPADTVPTEEMPDSLPAESQVSTETQVQEIAKPAAKPAVVTDTVRPGNFLARMAKRFYGNSHFWVYIYEENKAKISNPNNVAQGTIVVIPPAEKYGIDANSPASVEKAKRKEGEVLSAHR